MIALAFLVLVIGLFIWGLWARKLGSLGAQAPWRSDHEHLSHHAGDPVCRRRTAITGALLPVYVIVRRFVLGGTMVDNLPPGASEDLLLNLVTVGGIITIVVAVNRLIEHSKSD